MAKAARRGARMVPMSKAKTADALVKELKPSPREGARAAVPTCELTHAQDAAAGLRRFLLTFAAWGADRSYASRSQSVK